MILDKIVEATKVRVQEAKKIVPFEVMQKKALQMGKSPTFVFEEALKADGLSFICEVKKASPSKGVISEDFPYIQIAKNYEASGAAAISVLTEPKFFFGSNQYLKEIREAVTIPIIRKDFTIEPYQIYEAKVIGADAILLICSILTTEQLREMIQLADSLGFSCLVEAHTKAEVMQALEAGARIIGVNNRNLKTFEVDIRTSVTLRKYVPDSVVFVSESGMKTKEDMNCLRENGTDAVLVGEALMRSENVQELLHEFKGNAS